jgi:hypothetical protein
MPNSIKTQLQGEIKEDERTREQEIIPNLCCSKKEESHQCKCVG